MYVEAHLSTISLLYPLQIQELFSKLPAMADFLGPSLKQAGCIDRSETGTNLAIYFST